LERLKQEHAGLSKRLQNEAAKSSEIAAKMAQ
jgi:hypothetical protein